jgi:hypothetical protein
MIWSSPAIGRRHSAGVSILEVLFAILITTIGLLGAIAVFPAAMLQAKRGMQADGAAVAGQYSINRFDAEGMRQPSRWLLPSSTAPTSYWPNVPSISAPRVPPPDGQFAFCIDPRFVAANLGDSNAGYFPYNASAGPMVRVTLNNGAAGSATPMTPLHAELVFRVEDDVAYDRFRDGVVVKDDKLNAASLFVGGYANPLKRQTQGHVSWMATLSPKLERLPTGSLFEDRWVLSIVVFHDRPTELQAGGANPFPASEWVVNVTPSGGWVNGGDVTLTAPNTLPTGITNEEVVNVRTGQWIMLASQTLTNGRRMPLCRWYRVVDADEPNITATPATCSVTLAGADLTEATFPSVTPPVGIICRGVVAVYEKTIKLEPGL